MPTLGRDFLQALTNPPINQGLFNLGSAVGGMPGQYKAQKKEESFNALMQQGQAAVAQKDPNALVLISNQLSSLGYTKESAAIAQTAQELQTRQQKIDLLQGADLSTPAGQQSLFDLAASQGDIVGAAAATTERQKLLTAQKQQEAFTQRKVNLSNTAQQLGLSELAERIGTVQDPEELKEIAKEIRKIEIDKVPTTNPLIRRKMAMATGISAAEFESLGLATIPDKDFKEIIEGEKGTLEFYMLDDEVIQVRVDSFGMSKIWDEGSQTWKSASELGLREAPPQVQRIENIATGMADELSKMGAKTFVEGYEGAKKSAAALSTINRSLPNLENMFTGAGASIKLNLARWARTFGVPNMADPDSIADTELYIADSGVRVADYITNLGAGTGLSDADREYAKSIVGGNINVDEAALRKLLKILKVTAEQNIKTYQGVRADIKAALGPNNQDALNFFPDNFYIDSGPEGRDPAVDSYFPE